MDVITILNTIRDNASQEYKDRIPTAVADNMESIRFAMLDGDNIAVANEFFSVLVNKIIKSVVLTKRFENPLASLKKGTKPMGDTIEEIYANFMKGQEFDPSGANLLKRHLPDVKAVYHRMNYKLQYPITISHEQIAKAFKSYATMENFINSIINQMYNSANLDEYMNFKKILTSAIDKGAVKVFDIADPLLGETEGKEFIKLVKTISGYMCFPSTQYNGYLNVQTTDTTPITTLSAKNEQVLIIDTATDISVGVDVLATAFNMSPVEFNKTTKIVVDQFDDSDIRAMIVDKQFFQIYDDLYNTTAFNNPQGLYNNYYLNVWQTLAFSPLVNAVAFKVASDATP